MSPVRQGDNGLEKQLNWQLSCCNKWRFVRVGVAFPSRLTHHITQPNRDMANGKRQQAGFVAAIGIPAPITKDGELYRTSSTIDAYELVSTPASSDSYSHSPVKGRELFKAQRRKMSR